MVEVTSETFGIHRQASDTFRVELKAILLSNNVLVFELDFVQLVP